jgi:DNA-directed RNA polymerase subunit RPC12/RpoP
MMTTQQIKGLAERYQKAVELVEEGKVAPVYGQDGVYCVLNGEGYAYLVNLAQETCTCPDHQYRAKKLGIPCKHLIAAQLHRERHEDGGRGGKPRRRYQCDVCGYSVEADEDLTGTRCRACLVSRPPLEHGHYQPVADDERCAQCGGELDDVGSCPACAAYAEETYDGRYVREGDGTVSALW